MVRDGFCIWGLEDLRWKHQAPPVPGVLSEAGRGLQGLAEGIPRPCCQEPWFFSQVRPGGGCAGQLWEFFTSTQSAFSHILLVVFHVLLWQGCPLSGFPRALHQD